MADDFANARQAYEEFKQKSLHQDRELKHAKQQRDVLKNRLSTLSSRRADLDNQEKKLQQADAHFVEQIKNLQSAQAQRSSQETLLKQQLSKAKVSRNQAWVAWIFKQYQQFDNMTLGELQEWFNNAVKLSHQNNDRDNNSNNSNDSNNNGSNKVNRKVHRVLGTAALSGNDDDSSVSGDSNVGSSSESSDSSGGGGRSQYLKVRDEQRRIANEQRDTKMKNVDKATRSGRQKLNDSDKQESTMPLSKKQRIFINQDENDPIDTMSEALDAEALESPLGNRDAEEDADKYLSRQAKEQEKAHAKYSRDMDEFEL